MLWLLESGLVAIARLLLYLRLLGQVTNLFPQLTRRLSAGEPHARVRGPCAQFGGIHRSFKARGIERIPTIHEGYASREMEKRGGRGDLCEENRRIQALNRLLDALRAMIGRLSDQAQGILTAVKRRQRPSGAPQAPSSPEPAERPQERPQARETPPQAPQEPPKPIRTKKALTDRFKTRLDERLAENERKQAEKQAEPDMEETWDLSDPADPLNIGMGWGTGGHGLGL